MNKHSDSCIWNRDWTYCNCGFIKNQAIPQQLTLDFNKPKQAFDCIYCRTGYPDQGCYCKTTDT